MFADAFTIAITVLWVYARWNINSTLHLRQFIPYGHFHPFSCLNCSRLMKGLNSYNNVTDNWFVCVAVETCEKKHFDIFFDVSRIFFYPAFLVHGIFLLKFNWCAWVFRHFIFGKVWLLLFSTILNILISFRQPKQSLSPGIRQATLAPGWDLRYVSARKT